ncbi:MAG: methyltransferase domain-containing protein [Micavibrio sp.]|nr:methyltransferase domain-containing protein [Micavibrio sp.]
MKQEIYVLDKRLKLAQPENGFRTSIDAVLLAAACKIKTKQSVLDLGCGIGSAILSLLRRIPDIDAMGIDIQDDQIMIATDNANQNDLVCNFLAADIREFDHAPFDHIICNPPYNDAGAHVKSPSKSKALAMGHIETSLQDWLDAGCRLLQHGGTFAMIHKAGEVDDIIKGLKNRFGSVEIIPLYSKAGQSANRVIIRAIRNSKSPASIHAGLVLHKDDGSYTDETENILRHMQAIE